MQKKRICISECGRELIVYSFIATAAKVHISDISSFTIIFAEKNANKL